MLPLKLRALHSLLGTQLHITAFLLEAYPFELRTDALSVFDQDQAAYQSHALAYQKAMQTQRWDTAEIEGRIGDCIERYRENRDRLTEVLQMAYVAPREHSIRTAAQALKAALDPLDTLLDAILHRPDFNAPTVEAHYQSVRRTIDTALADLKTALSEFKAVACSERTFSKLHTSDVYESFDLTPEDWQWGKWHQHTLVALRSRLNDFRPWFAPTSPLKITLPNIWLPTSSAYTDLLVCAQLLQPACVLAGLARQKEMLAHLYQQIESILERLQTRYGDRLEPWIRLKVTLRLYEQWQNVLNALATRIQQTGLSPFQKACQIESALTYEKKALFQQLLTQQRFFALLFAIEREEMVPSLEELRATQTRVQTSLTQQETTLRKHYKPRDGFLATAWLAITHQPDFEWGQWMARVAMGKLDAHPQIPILGTPLPPHIAHRTTQAIGLSCLGLSLSMSSYLGYSYHLLASINRFLLAHPQFLFKLGRAYEAQIATILPTLKRWPQLQRALRGDEIGILEKEAQLAWFSGLILNSLLTMRISPKLGACAYVFASTSGYAAAGTVQTLLASYDLSTETETFAKIVAHATIYTLAYHQGIHWFRPQNVPQKLLTKPEALQRLGFFNPPSDISAKEIRNRYYDLARQYHPDQCQSIAEVCHQTMTQINEAYTTLVKKG